MTLVHLTTIVAWLLIGLAFCSFIPAIKLYTKARGHRFDEDHPTEHTTYIRTNMTTWRSLFTITLVMAAVSASTTITRITLTDANADRTLLATAVWAVLCLASRLIFGSFRSEYASIQRWNHERDKLSGRRPS